MVLQHLISPLLPSTFGWMVVIFSKKMKHKLLLLLATLCICCGASAQNAAVNVAKKFCTAVYNNDMVTAKSYMTPEDARRTPDRMSFPNNEGREYLQRLRNSRYKIIENQYSSSIVTVRFYDPKYEYLAREGRWFCCSVELVEVKKGVWKVSDYGY